MSNYNQFRDKLREIFMMDHAELDFGIYRIMNQKRGEINKFLEKELLPQVKKILGGSNSDTAKALQQELDKAIKQCQDLEIDPNTNKKVIELREKIDASSAGNEELENEVFNHLTIFFSRYYDNGDFVSKRRYKDNAYAIPYNGEEVKLHWANSDQYYIKTSEYFQNYTFNVTVDEKANIRKKVHFVLKDVTTEQNNNKAASGMERRFALYQDEEAASIEVIQNEDGEDELNIYFTYELMPKGTKQDALMASAFDSIKGQLPDDFKVLTDKLCPTEKNKKRTLLEKHLTDYTAKNSFDYFIHKDLGGFLRRELDFYIKNEVLLIDDLDEKHVMQQLSLVRAIKGVGEKIITMLAQIEDFQKRLWLKKKFVVQSDYCITLDRVPESFYAEICENEAQRKEWVRLFAIDEIQGYSEPLAEDFLRQNTYLVLDTAFFTLSFKHRLQSKMEDVDKSCNGLLINSENFQAMHLLHARYDNCIGAIITDPPYNTGDDDFLYKDNYMDSSWISMMDDRMKEMYPFMTKNSWCSFNINDKELFNLMELSEQYGWSSRTNITVKMSHLSGMKMSHIDKKVPKIKESIVVFSKGDDYSLNPIYEPCDWDEAFERYTGWVNFNESEDPLKWTRTTVRNAAKEHCININDKEEYDGFRISNANHIFRTAVNDSLSEMPKDNIFREVISAQGLKKIILNREEVLFASTYMKMVDGKLMPVQPKGDIWSDIGINNVHNEGGVQLPNGKKPVKLFERLINMLSNEGDIIMDIFAGSATIVHAAINTNANHKYIAIQSDYSYFNEKTKRRSENVIYSSEWKLDKPVSRKGISQCFKYIRLEQYEDTLNNLEVKPQGGLFDKDEDKDFHESYMLQYMMDMDTRDSLFNIERFVHPFDVKLKTTRDNELVETNVDMVETFNYLIGLEVDTIRWTHGDEICVVEGRLHRNQDKALIIWRDTEKVDNTELNAFFRRNDYHVKDSEFDVIYVNGDNTLQNQKRDDEHWKVVLIEEEFQKRMFEEC